MGEEEPYRMECRVCGTEDHYSDHDEATQEAQKHNGICGGEAFVAYPPEAKPDG